VRDRRGLRYRLRGATIDESIVGGWQIATDLADVLLDHEVFPDQLDVGRDRPPVVGCGRAARDMRWRAGALVFGVGCSVIDGPVIRG
jgi:hypothetical protein